jgi:hypothetical protein
VEAAQSLPKIDKAKKQKSIKEVPVLEVKEIEIQSLHKLEQKEAEIEDHLLHNEPALLKPAIRSDAQIKQ